MNPLSTVCAVGFILTDNLTAVFQWKLSTEHFHTLDNVVDSDQIVTTSTPRIYSANQVGPEQKPVPVWGFANMGFFNRANH